METGDESATAYVITCSFFINNIIYRMLCFVRIALQRFLSHTLISHTFNSIAWKASQMCKVHTSCHERANEPYVTSNYENKTMTADLTTNYDAETNTLFAEKIKNAREHNLEGGANNSELDKDTDRSNLNSKVKFRSLALLLNVLFLSLVLLGSILVKYDLVFRT